MKFMNSCLIRNLSRYSLQRLAAPFSSSSATSHHPRFSNFFSDDVEGGSAVCKHALKFERPSKIKWQQHLKNSVSFIGSVDLPLQIIDTKYGGFGVYTRLKVQNSRDSIATFRIRVQMWEELGRKCIKHLKQNDFIYVCGRLGSYTKADDNGNLRLYYRVNVKELNYVAHCGQGPTCRKSEESDSGGGEAGMEKYENNLYLWQVFFTNPYEWWDNRNCKVNPRQPDFKHKDTGEALWLNPNDPPWIKRQLQLIDLKMAEQGRGEDVGPRSHVSMWVYDD